MPDVRVLNNKRLDVFAYRPDNYGLRGSLELLSEYLTSRHLSRIPK